MLPVRLGLTLTVRLWSRPTGLLLALFCLASGPLLTFLAPRGALSAGVGGGPSLTGLALLGGAGLALSGLGRRAAFLELLPLRARLQVQATALLATSLGAVALMALAAQILHGWSLPILGAPFAALRLAGIALPLLAFPMQGATRVVAFLALTWWLPALALEGAGWQGHLRRALLPDSSLLRGTSESIAAGTMLPAACLAVAVALGGALTARTVSRIR